jgi:hypothetical protein
MFNRIIFQLKTLKAYVEFTNIEMKVELRKAPRRTVDLKIADLRAQLLINLRNNNNNYENTPNVYNIDFYFDPDVDLSIAFKQEQVENNISLLFVFVFQFLDYKI